VAIVVVDDHLLPELLAGQGTADLDVLAVDGIATTGLWLFRLCASFADPRVSGKLSAPVALLPTELQPSFRAQIVALPPEITALSMRDLAWPMARLQARHRAEGRNLSAAMVEALAAAHDTTSRVSSPSRATTSARTSGQQRRPTPSRSTSCSPRDRNWVARPPGAKAYGGREAVGEAPPTTTFANGR
jgi:hypothetical protein